MPVDLKYLDIGSEKPSQEFGKYIERHNKAGLLLDINIYCITGGGTYVILVIA
jgi:hypothetical protein